MQVQKPDVDLRYLVEQELGAALYRGSRVWMFRCPFHEEQHGYSLAVYANGWKCWGACNEHGDAIDWMQRRHEMSFRQACTALNAQVDYHQPVLPAPRRVESAPPEGRWQQQGKTFAAFAQSNLWKPSGGRALVYLHSRGLADETIRSANLGYWPGSFDQWRRFGGLSIPCGIVIPWYGAGALWSLKVRRAAGEVRYGAVRGGNNQGLYGVDRVAPAKTALIVEGEFDALVAQQECGGWLCALTLGAATNRLSPRWREKLVACQRVLVATDNDAAGERAAEHLLSLLPGAVRICVPHGVKDLNALHLSGTGQVKRFLETYRS